MPPAVPLVVVERVIQDVEIVLGEVLVQVEAAEQTRFLPQQLLEVESQPVLQLSLVLIIHLLALGLLQPRETFLTHKLGVRVRQGAARDVYMLL